MAVTGKHSRYRYISTLGSGGMATVVLAEDTLLSRPVALKRMTTAADPQGLSRLRREALAGASLSHPNLVSIYDVVTSEEGDLVIVMEYVRGETLRDALRRQGKLAPSEALRILEGVAAGLDTIHRQGIVHRDVKPPNILLGADGTVKVADLGIASVPDRTQITTTGAVLGSFSYMAPEQLEGGATTPAIDVYALAAVTFEVLSGLKARREPNPVALAHAISTQPPPDLRDAWPQAPPVLAELLMRGMSRDPAQRPRSAGELIGRLRSALEPMSTAPMATRSPSRGLAPRGLSSRALPPPVNDRHESRRWLLPAALMALGAAAIALVLLLNPGSQPRSRPGAQSRVTSSHRSHSSHASTGATGTDTATRTAAAPPAAGSPATTTSSSTSAAAAPPSHGNPVSAVESFYELAAAHRYADAWALADPTFRNQLGGYRNFEAGQSGDRSITFNAAQLVSRSSNSAMVAIKTTSVRTDGTHHCAGTVDLRPDGPSGRWLLHLIQINCT